MYPDSLGQGHKKRSIEGVKISLIDAELSIPKTYLRNSGPKVKDRGAATSKMINIFCIWN